MTRPRAGDIITWHLAIRFHNSIMDAAPLLASVGRALREQKLEAVLIGNAGAALHGAPVTTLDFDFMFRDTPANLLKLKRVARSLRCMILRPYYPVSKLYRLVDDDRGLQLDFMPVIHGIRTFESLRSRAEPMRIGAEAVLVASLADIVKSKKAAARPRDRAVIDILEATLGEKEK